MSINMYTRFIKGKCDESALYEQQNDVEKKRQYAENSGLVMRCLLIVLTIVSTMRGDDSIVSPAEYCRKN